jgi:hypothetical protein
VVTDHYREQARVVIAALDHLRTGGDSSQMSEARRVGSPGASHRDMVNDVRPGTTIIYRPSGEQRASPCRIVAIQGDRAYLAPILRTCVGWVSMERLEAIPNEQPLIAENSERLPERRWAQPLFQGTTEYHQRASDMTTTVGDKVRVHCILPAQ